MMTNPLLLIDFYKATHSEQYPKGLTKIVSYYTPRMSRLKDTDKVVLFGLQAFIKEYLIEGFNTYFFNRPVEEVVAEYTRVLNYTMGEGSYDATKITKLHGLGYLPLQISALPEGTRSNIGVPQIEITNTHPDFVWLVNTIETLLSCTMWHTQTSAEVGYRYRQIVDRYVQKTCGSDVNPANVLGDFSMRGQQSAESAIKSSAGWLLSFNNTATVPAIMWLEKNYNCNIENETVGRGAISTEHSVMCSNFAVDCNEITHIKRLLTEIYPNHSFSMVSDSYDYWNLVTNLLPQCKEEVMAHNGYIGIRGDSGDPIEVIAGVEYFEFEDEEDFEYFTEYPGRWVQDVFYNREDSFVFIGHFNDEYVKVFVDPDWTNERGAWTDTKYYYVDGYNISIERNYQPTAEDMGTVWALWEQFGGTYNEKGYKVLDPHVKAIYGDSITPQRCEEIYKRLTDKGFAVNNCVLGVGSFSMMCLETIGREGAHYNPYTRDTFGIAVKATYAEDKDGNPIMIMKQPKGCEWKKSQKGCCIVRLDQNGDYICEDNHTWEEVDYSDVNQLKTVFHNGKMFREWNLAGIRTRMYGVQD